MYSPKEHYEAVIRIEKRVDALHSKFDEVLKVKPQQGTELMRLSEAAKALKIPYSKLKKKADLGAFTVWKSGRLRMVYLELLKEQLL